MAQITFRTNKDLRVAAFIAGSPEELEKAKGELAVSERAASRQLKISVSHLRRLANEGTVRPRAFWRGTPLYLLTDLRALAGNNLALAQRTTAEFIKLRHQVLKHQPCCSACWKPRLLVVHHIEPFYRRPDLELETGNLIVLCEDDHLFLGHGGDFGHYNPNVKRDAAEVLKSPVHRAKIERKAKAARAQISPRTKPREPPVDLSAKVIVAHPSAIYEGGGEEAVSLEDAADILGVTRERVSQLLSEGKLARVASIERVSLILRAEIDALKSQREIHGRLQQPS